MNELEVLEWSAWFPWNNILSGKTRPPARPGVYEARCRNQEIRLTIGETSLLKRRISYLVRGDGPHAAGERIRASENVADVLVRWAVTEQHEEIEQQLHQEHRGELYTKVPSALDF